MKQASAKNSGGADQFALIATAHPSDRTAGLVKPQPPVLPPILLPVEVATGRQFFTPTAELTIPIFSSIMVIGFHAFTHR